MEYTLLIVKEVFVYAIPPRSTARGYRASDWDVNKFIWSGRLKVTARKMQDAEIAIINLEDGKTSNSFL